MRRPLSPATKWVADRCGLVTGRLHAPPVAAAGQGGLAPLRSRRRRWCLPTRGGAPPSRTRATGEAKCSCTGGRGSGARPSQAAWPLVRMKRQFAMGVGESSAGPGRRRGASAREGAGLPSNRKYQLKIEDDYCPVIGSKINMDGISDQEVADAYSFVFSFDEVLRSIKLEEGHLLIHIADLYEIKRSLDDKITSLKAAVKSSPSADILRRIKSTRTKNNETQEEIYAHKLLLAKTRLKLVKFEARHRASTFFLNDSHEMVRSFIDRTEKNYKITTLEGRN
uniref:Uncharacterized protein n=4 Tax=Oryza TaxID=4527 RepID=A0A0E0CBB0_9ORYZ